MSSHYTFDDVDANRQKSPPLQKCIAPILNSDMFKSPRCFTKPASKDFTHRLNLESRTRMPATLKASGAFLRSDTINLGYGRPGPQYFPLHDMTLGFMRESGITEEKSEIVDRTHTGKYDMTKANSSMDLAVALNYSYSGGSEQLVRFLTEHVDIVHNPPYSNWQVSLTIGNTSALDAAFRIFCSRGDFVLMERYTYSGAIEAIRPMGLRAAAVDMDENGLVPCHLDSILQNWDEVARGAKKPFLLYIVPTGQNPTGISQPLERRKEIYAIAEKHDLLIMEDEPYFYLQFDDQENMSSPAQSGSSNHQKFLQFLIPSYLSLDVSGRVLRLDSTAKIIAPGMRCAWMTGASTIVERFLHLHDVGIVSPSGMSQVIMYELLERAWGHLGFMDWLMYLRSEYSRRRQVVIQACNKSLPQTICSWHTPTAGMFIWIKIAWQRHPKAGTMENQNSTNDLLAIEERIFATALNHGVMCCKGSIFNAEAVCGDEMFFRLSFASATKLHLEEAIMRLGTAINEEFGL